MKTHEARFQDILKSIGQSQQEAPRSAGQGCSVWKTGFMNHCLKACCIDHALHLVLELMMQHLKSIFLSIASCSTNIPGILATTAFPFKVHNCKPHLDSISFWAMGRAEPTDTLRVKMTVSGLPWKSKGDSWFKTGLFRAFLEKPLSVGHC